MPLREGRAKLWFKTKEEQDEFDDNMIASINIESDNYDDDSFTPIFKRQKKQFYLGLTDNAKRDIEKFYPAKKDFVSYLDRYHLGKRDHTFNRQWTVQKFALGYGVSYLFIRELPIRNFYARAFIMFFFLNKIMHTWGNNLTIMNDKWNYKHLRNYEAYKNHFIKVIPSHENRLPEARLWKLNQPGFLRPTPSRFLDTCMTSLLAPPEEKEVSWDGTWNMPLEGLAHPKHKDAKWVDFVYQ